MEDTEWIHSECVKWWITGAYSAYLKQLLRRVTVWEFLFSLSLKKNYLFIFFVWALVACSVGSSNMWNVTERRCRPDNWVRPWATWMSQWVSARETETFPLLSSVLYVPLFTPLCKICFMVYSLIYSFLVDESVLHIRTLVHTSLQELFPDPYRNRKCVIYFRCSHCLSVPDRCIIKILSHWEALEKFCWQVNASSHWPQAQCPCTFDSNPDQCAH